MYALTSKKYKKVTLWFIYILLILFFISLAIDFIPSEIMRDKGFTVSLYLALLSFFSILFMLYKVVIKEADPGITLPFIFFGFFIFWGIYFRVLTFSLPASYTLLFGVDHEMEVQVTKLFNKRKGMRCNYLITNKYLESLPGDGLCIPNYQFYNIDGEVMFYISGQQTTYGFYITDHRRKR